MHADVARRAEIMDKHGTADSNSPENVNHPLPVEGSSKCYIFRSLFFRIDILGEHRQEHGPHTIFNVVHLTRI